MQEKNIKTILKNLLKNFIENKSPELSVAVDEFATLIKKENIKISNELDEILDNLMSLHHYGNDNDFSLSNEEIREIYNNL